MNKEYHIQKSVIEWARWQKFNDGKVADYLHHSPNGGYRTKSEGGKFKAMGTLAGFPDLFLFVAKGGYFGLFIELKADGGRLSDNQSVMLYRLTQMGYKTAVCVGAKAAIDEIVAYLGKDDTERQECKVLS